LKNLVFERETMASGKENKFKFDPLTGWAVAANEILKILYPKEEFEEQAYKDNMLMLVKALDQGDLDKIFGNTDFMKKTEDLLLAMLRGKQIDVTDPIIYNARNEIFAAAQVIYNQAVARGFWKLHPEINRAIENNQ